jgi:hypothetical protein
VGDGEGDDTSHHAAVTSNEPRPLTTTGTVGFVRPAARSAPPLRLRAEFRFPVFSATPNVSVQIISSTGAAPTQVHAVKIEEISGISGLVETQIVVEAETIFDVSAGGIYYANLVVTGVPVIPPTKANSAELLH